MKYSFNGLILPALPESAKKFPYQVISKTGVTLECFEQEPRVGLTEEGWFGYRSPGLVRYYYVLVREDNSLESATGWLYINDHTMKDHYICEPGWANFDLKTVDGAVYLAGSEAIPIYEELTIKCVGGMVKGSSQDISCTIDGIRRVPFSCTLSGNTSGETTLTKLTDLFYQLRCGINETASQLTITATSSQFPELTATKNIKVAEFPGDPDDPDNPGGSGGGSGYPDNPEDFVYAETPTITAWGDHATYNVGDIAEPLVCEASVSDGGILTYEWFCNDILVSDTDTCVPTTEVEATDFYHCVVTNTLGGSTATMMSDIVMIEVLEGTDTDNLPDAGSFIQGWLMGRMIRLRGFPKKEETT